MNSNKWTTEKPAVSGYYYYAPSIKDWDLYRVAPVQSILDSNGLRFEIYLDPYGYNRFLKMISFYNKRWIDVNSPEFKDFIWWGPLPKPQQPERLL